MVPITINRSNVLQWVWFGILEMVHLVLALFRGSFSREDEVTRVVEAKAEKGSPASVIEVMDAYATKRRFLMNVGVEKGALLRELMISSEAKNVLELGAYCGYSAVLMGESLKEQNGRLVSIEANPKNAARAERVVAHAGLAEHVEFRIGKGSERIPDLEGSAPFDLVFIDHWKDDYLPDLLALEELGLLAEGAVVVADNVGIFSNTLDDYLDYVRTDPRYVSSFHSLPMEYTQSIQDGVEVSFFKGASPQTAAA